LKKAKKSLNDRVKAIFRRKSQFKVEMKLGRFKVKPNHTCDMCGIKKATCVILDPNIYPENDYSNRKHYWDVCKECRKFVNWGMGKSYEVMIEVACDKATKSSKAGA
jgi:hypothetical protein